MQIPMMNKKGSNLDNSAGDRLEAKKVGYESENTRKENLEDHREDMEPPADGGYNCISLKNVFVI